MKSRAKQLFPHKFVVFVSSTSSKAHFVSILCNINKYLPTPVHPTKYQIQNVWDHATSFHSQTVKLSIFLFFLFIFTFFSLFLLLLPFLSFTLSSLKFYCFQWSLQSPPNAIKVKIIDFSNVGLKLFGFKAVSTTESNLQLVMDISPSTMPKKGETEWKRNVEHSSIAMNWIARREWKRKRRKGRICEKIIRLLSSTALIQCLRFCHCSIFDVLVSVFVCWFVHFIHSQCHLKLKWCARYQISERWT